MSKHKRQSTSEGVGWLLLKFVGRLALFGIDKTAKLTLSWRPWLTTGPNRVRLVALSTITSLLTLLEMASVFVAVPWAPGLIVTGVSCVVTFVIWRTIHTTNQELLKRIDNLETLERFIRDHIVRRQSLITDSVRTSVQGLGGWALVLWTSTERWQVWHKSKEESRLARTRIVLIQDVLKGPRKLTRAFGMTKGIRAAAPLGAIQNQEIQHVEREPQGPAHTASTMVGAKGAGKSIALAEAAAASLRRGDANKVFYISCKEADTLEAKAEFVTTIAESAGIDEEEIYCWPGPIGVQGQWAMFRGVTSESASMDQFVKTFMSLISPEQVLAEGGSAHYYSFTESFLTHVYFLRKEIGSIEDLNSLVNPDAMKQLAKRRIAKLKNEDTNAARTEMKTLVDNVVQPIEAEYEGKKARDLEASSAKLRGNLKLLTEEVGNVLVGEKGKFRGVHFDDDYKVFVLHCPVQFLAVWMVKDLCAYIDRTAGDEPRLVIIDEVGSLPKNDGELIGTPVGDLLVKKMEQWRSIQVHLSLAGQSVGTFGTKSIERFTGAGSTLLLGKSTDPRLKELLIQVTTGEFQTEVRQDLDGSLGMGSTRIAGVEPHFLHHLMTGSFVAAAFGRWIVIHVLHIAPPQRRIDELASLMKSYGGKSARLLREAIETRPIDELLQRAEIVPIIDGQIVVPQTDPLVGVTIKIDEIPRLKRTVLEHGLTSGANV